MRAFPSLGLHQYGFRAALAGAMLLTAAGTATAGDRAGAVLGGAALGLLGGVALGSALAAPPPPPPYYRPRPVYVEAPRPVYVDAPRSIYDRPAPGPICHFERRKTWLNDIEFTYRRVEVCE